LARFAVLTGVDSAHLRSSAERGASMANRAVTIGSGNQTSSDGFAGTAKRYDDCSSN